MGEGWLGDWVLEVRWKSRGEVNHLKGKEGGREGKGKQIILFMDVVLRLLGLVCFCFLKNHFACGRFTIFHLLPRNLLFEAALGRMHFHIWHFHIGKALCLLGTEGRLFSPAL